ncbi:hypothetical protein [Dactylosporangium fulvum]|uniref:Uncharacterized protein n=1 Tax=Dactylosporangium fulvum TaxID=53359 RepID=A0ABY5W345_9ACTN|nr:hypothetical protein [Dactylosporangium fulvum]UWP83143.1 hypothetical protein Dfulv_02205 [Dactylosporangium fulvum]
MVPWLDSPDDADRQRARSVLGERGAASAGEGWDQLAQARRAPVFAPQPSPADSDVAVIDYLDGSFPPERPIPPIPPHLLATVHAEAHGEPGDPVWPGLFPSTRAKLARLALARWREYPAGVVLRAAEHAYGRYRSHYDGSYHAHDALACALVHPDVDAVALADRYGGHHRGERGWKSRRKTWQLLRWARRHGYLPGLTRCACGHDWFVAPPTQQAAVALAGHWTAIRPLLVSEAVDIDRWLAVFRCSRCGEFWAEDSIPSGHAELFFGYPIHTRDPRGWLARAHPFDLPA